MDYGDTIANEAIAHAAAGPLLLMPFADETVTISKEEYVRLIAEVSFYKGEHERSIKQVAKLTQEIEDLQGQIRDLQQRLFGRKTEKKSSSGNGSEQQHPESTQARGARGQRRGSRGHGRTTLPDLPVVEQEVDLDEDKKQCPKCGLAFIPSTLTQASETIEVEVKAYIRRVKRKCYRPGCRCDVVPGIIAAPVEPRVIPRCKLGISGLVELLIDKYHYCRPTHRLLQSWETLGLKVAPGTVIGWFKQLMPLFEPLLAAFRAKQLTEGLCNLDETIWYVHERIEGKASTRWYLWLARSRSVCYYILDPSRSALVPINHFSDLLVETIAVCDRYKAYHKMARVIGMLLAFCWAHVRRDFLKCARSYPQLSTWAADWVDRIGLLYHLNEKRLEVLTDASAFAKADALLIQHLEAMAAVRDQSLADKDLHAEARKVLESLSNHWAGLTVFVAHPEVPLDNNRAEQAVRNPVCGRKNYFGSVTKWAGEFAAMMFTVFMTLTLCWRINPRLWLREYLQACAANGGQSPPDLTPFLPWTMDQARLAFFRGPAPASPPFARADSS